MHLAVAEYGLGLVGLLGEASVSIEGGRGGGGGIGGGGRGKDQRQKRTT
jgi:hypothetical protein